MTWDIMFIWVNLALIILAWDMFTKGSEGEKMVTKLFLITYYVVILWNVIT